MSDSDVEHEGRQAGGRLVRVEMGALRGRAEDKAPFGGPAVAGWRDVQTACRVRDQVGLRACDRWGS